MLFPLLLCLVATGASAQTSTPTDSGSTGAPHVWTLAQCIDRAVEQGITVRQAEAQRQQRAIQLSTAKGQRLPDLSASAAQNFSFGRGLTAENTYTNTNTSSTTFSLGTTLPLFTGGRLSGQVRQGQLNLDAATHDLEKARNDIRVQVAQAYVQVLYDTEILLVARRQVAVDSLQVERLEALFRGGKASQSEVSAQASTLAQSRLTATQAAGTRSLSLLALSQLLELPSPEGFEVELPGVLRRDGWDALLAQADSLGGALTPDVIYAEALATRPEVLAEQTRLLAADQGIAIARAALYPQLNMSGGIGSNYYKTSGFRADAFGRQLSNNFSQYVGLNLSIPLFNRFQTRGNIRSARVERTAQSLQLESVRKALYKEIQQAYYNTVAAQSKLAASVAAAASSQDAFALVQARYENGRATSTEFNEAKNNCLKAESDLVQARCELLYQQALLRFYRGLPLSF